MSGYGTWWLRSPSDLRWNADGRGFGGLFGVPECEKKVEELKVELGEPPEDLEYGFCKD